MVYFCTIFNIREATVTTFVKWLAAERIARAQQLLETTDLSIERVAPELGFGTALSLLQHFASQLHTSHPLHTGGSFVKANKALWTPQSPNGQS